MGRFAQADEVVAQIYGANLDGFRWTGDADSDVLRNALIEGEIQEAEAWVESFIQANVTPLAQRVEVMNGKGTAQIRLAEMPIVDVQQVQVRLDIQADPRTYAATDLRIDKCLGIVSVKPGIFISQVSPFTQGSPYWFPRGTQNIVVNYRTGYAVIGNNVALATLTDEGYPDVAQVTTDASYAYFTAPRPFSSYAKGSTLSVRGAQVMLKDAVDVSSQWTMRSPTQLRCAIADYSSSAKFVLVYVPSAIGAAVVKSTAAGVLVRKGVQAVPGSANGATSLSAGGFSENYGEMQYAGQVKQWLTDAQDLLRPYRRMHVR